VPFSYSGSNPACSPAKKQDQQVCIWSIAMSSILTNTAALTALSSLNKTQSALQMTQNRISTGLRVGSASDNAAYWSIATTMRSDNSSLAAVKDALGVGSATADIAYTGTNAAIDLATQIKNKLVTALQPGVDRAKIQADITQLQKQLKSTADSSTIAGQNFLSVDSSSANYNATASTMSSYTRAGGVITTGTIDISVTSSKLYDSADQSGLLDKVGTSGSSVDNLDISALTDSSGDATKMKQMIADVDTAISGMTTSASTLGAAKTRMTNQSTFIDALSKAITSGIGTLVDADMTEESTKLSALQVQQQLGTQALSIANQSSQSILSLFR
jgi:flagellin